MILNETNTFFSVQSSHKPFKLKICQLKTIRIAKYLRQIVQSERPLFRPKIKYANSDVNWNYLESEYSLHAGIEIDHVFLLSPCIKMAIIFDSWP